MPKKNADAIRKPELINATLECIASVGIDATTLDMVAARAGCSKGVAAYHFGTKQRLVTESLRAFLASYQARMGDSTVTSARDWLTLLIDTSLPPWDPVWSAQANSSPAPRPPLTETPINVFPVPDARAITISPAKKARLFVNFIARACQDEEVRSILAERYASDSQGIATILSAAAREAGSSLENPDEAAYRFLALVYGLAFFRVADFFPSGCTDNRHILTTESGGIP